MAEVQRRESGLVVGARGHVRVLTLDRPERRNALSSALQADLVEELLCCGEDGEVRAVVLAANGPAFCAGFDLDEIRELDRRGERFRPPMDRPTRALFEVVTEDRKSTRLNSSHANISYAVFCLKKEKSETVTT